MSSDLRPFAPFAGLFVVLIAGCAQQYEPPPPPPAPAPAAAPAAPPPAPMPAPAPAHPMPMQMGGHTVELMPLNDSGVHGTAMIRGTGAGQTEVTVNLRTAGSGTHEGHIHSGTCSDIGAPVHPLEPVTTDASGAGMSATELATQPMTLMDGNHLVAFHEAGGHPGAPVVCGQIPAMQHP